MNSFVKFINPIEHLGSRKYSILFSLILSFAVVLLSEIYSLYVARDPNAVGAYIVFFNAALIVYFSFRDGIRGGLSATAVSVIYYLYIIYSRNYSGAQLISSLETTLVLALLYIFISMVIGWLKQKIDQLIEAEADEKNRLQSILAQLPVGILIADMNLEVVYTNKQIEKILGLKIPTGYKIGIDKPLVNGTWNDKPVTLNDSPIVHTIKTGKPITGREFAITRKDNKRAFIQISSSLITNIRGGNIAGVSIITDITKNKELDMRKDDFINMASHELKTPMTSLKLYVSILKKMQKDISNIKIGTIVKNIEHQAGRLERLVADLLDVSRLQTGKLIFTKQKFDLNKLIRETVDTAQSTTSNHEIVFRKSKNVIVEADRFRIYQVISNLLTNAVKYSPKSKSISVDLKKSGDEIVVSVKDRGVGIARDEKSRIFEKLYQVKANKEKTFPGFGMGLFIAKEIVKRHKGKIWVESEPGRGSTFYFSLPV